ncbi:646_t:CDS:2, partial [Ambispora gerdemannii]
RLQQDLDNWDNSPPSDSHNKKLLAIEISINEASTKMNKILETKKETIPPEISQKTEDPLELFKRTQKDAKKSRAIARTDIFKLSILNSKV